MIIVWFMVDWIGKGWYACTTSMLIPRWQLCPHERPPGTVVCFRVNSVPCLGSLTYHPASSIAAWSCAIDLLPTRVGVLTPRIHSSHYTPWEEGLVLPECIWALSKPGMHCSVDRVFEVWLIEGSLANLNHILGVLCVVVCLCGMECNTSSTDPGNPSGRRTFSNSLCWVYYTSGGGFMVLCLLCNKD